MGTPCSCRYPFAIHLFPCMREGHPYLPLGTCALLYTRPPRGARHTWCRASASSLPEHSAPEHLHLHLHLPEHLLGYLCWAFCWARDSQTPCLPRRPASHWC
jgi:hypothetical protein